MDQIIKIAKEILNKDELWMLRVLLAETIHEVKAKKLQETPFESYTVSPKGDSISGPLFTVY